jgi:hypothetical protein
MNPTKNTVVISGAPAPWPDPWLPEVDEFEVPVLAINKFGNGEQFHIHVW